MNNILPWRSPTRKLHRRRTIIASIKVPALIIAGLGGYVVFDRTGLVNRLTLAITAPHTDAHNATFSYCGQGTRTTCVKDGDTFWLSGEKIRIADIDAPELSSPRCEAERIKGENSRGRLLELLNTGTVLAGGGV